MAFVLLRVSISTKMIYSSPFKNIFTLDLWMMEISEMTHAFHFHLISVKRLGTVFPLLSLGSPRDEG